MRRSRAVLGGFAWLVLPLSGLAAGVAALLAAGTLPPRGAWLRPAYLLGVAMLVAAVLLSPTPFLPWERPEATPTANLLFQGIEPSRWSSGLASGSVVAGPRGDDVACVALPPGRSLATTLHAPAAGVTLTGSVHLRTTGPERAVRLRLGPPGSGGASATFLVGASWTRAAVSASVGEGWSRAALAITNPDAEGVLEVCAWGAQVEVGDEPSPYASVQEVLAAVRPAGWERWPAAAVVALAALAAPVAVGALGAMAERVTAGHVALLAAGGLTHAVIAFVQVAAGDGRPSGLAGHANLLAGQALAAGLCLWLAARRASVPRWLVVAGIGALGAVVAVTGSRTALLAAAASAGVALANAGGRRRSGLLMAALAGLALVVVSVWRFGTEAVAWSSSRLDIYRSAAAAWARSPWVGHGTRTAALQLAADPAGRMSEPPSHAHDVLLQVGLELGWVGVVGLALTLLGLLGRRPAGQGLGAVVAAALVLGAFDLAPLDPVVYVPLVVAVLLATASSRAISSARPEPT